MRRRPAHGLHHPFANIDTYDTCFEIFDGLHRDGLWDVEARRQRSAIRRRTVRRIECCRLGEKFASQRDLPGKESLRQLSQAARFRWPCFVPASMRLRPKTSPLATCEIADDQDIV